jgi:acyl carrier protein
MTAADIAGRVRRVVAEHSHLEASAYECPEQLNLHDAGMTSFESVNIMVIIEDEFDIEFPDHMLRREVFESVASMKSAVAEVLGMSLAPGPGDDAALLGRPGLC